MTTYPNPCCRCGFCCLAEPCPIIIREAGVERGPCPFLDWDLAGLAVCRFLMERPERADEFGIGKGCCCAAHAVNATTGATYDFASLLPEIKIPLAKKVAARNMIYHRRDQNIPTMTGQKKA